MGAVPVQAARTLIIGATWGCVDMCPEGSPVCKATFSHKILGGWELACTPTSTFLQREYGRPFSWLSSFPLTPQAELFPLGASALPQCPGPDRLL